MAEEIQTWTNKVTQLYFQSMSAEKQMVRNPLTMSRPKSTKYFLP